MSTKAGEVQTTLFALGAAPVAVGEATIPYFVVSLRYIIWTPTSSKLEVACYAKPDTVTLCDQISHVTHAVIDLRVLTTLSKR